MSLRHLFAIARLAEEQGLPLAEVGDAVRCFKVGALDNPWKKAYLRERIRRAPEEIGRRVKGQTPAIVKTVDILMRSVTSLTGAQTAAPSGRPRGVLFFAGPTGVGKTELARALTALIFGDERAYIRFDMSEFAAEHADARLLGAPPAMSATTPAANSPTRSRPSRSASSCSTRSKKPTRASSTSSCKSSKTGA